MTWNCEYELDGYDTDGTAWHRCTTHDELAPSPDAPCAGWEAPAYINHTFMELLPKDDL